MEFEVHTDQLERTVTSMQTTLEDIEQTRNRILQGFESLSGMWEGAAHDAFQVRYQENDTLLQTLCQDVRTILENASTARVEYDKCEAAIWEEISRIHI